MINISPIITSMLDDDFYKLSMGAVVLHNFPEVIVKYEFINRNRTPFPSGFDVALQKQINHLSYLRLTPEEEVWLKTNHPYLKSSYIEWLRGYIYDPNEVKFELSPDGVLKLHICGFWYRTILWEVKLMAIISELYFRMTGQEKSFDWRQKIFDKSKILSSNGCHWMDFGTRRRFSLEVQDAVVQEMRLWEGFLGTSNPYLAMKYGVEAKGTYAHEAPMAMSALVGPRLANRTWIKYWSDYYNGLLGIALTDTFSTEVFLMDFDSYYARLYDGARQDSGNPYFWADHQMLPHYKKLKIDPLSKAFVFSDNLKVGPSEQLMIGNSYNYVFLDKYYRDLVKPVGGIGTFFSNEVGVTPLNMVIKLTGADFGNGFVDVVKLSDNPEKNTGNPEAIERVKRELNIIP